MEFRILDLFAGTGALSKGISENKNFKTVMAVDSLGALKKTFDENNSVELTVLDVAGDSEEIIRDAKEKDVNMIVADFPYQRLPLTSSRFNPTDKRLKNLNSSIDMIKTLSPEVFILSFPCAYENAFDGKLMESVKSIEGYRVKDFVINAKDHGIALNEEKYIVTGSKSRFININNIKREKTTLKAAIGDLNYLTAGKGEFESEYKRTPKPSFASKDGKLYNHQASNHSRKTVELMKKGSDFLRADWNRVLPKLTSRFDQAFKGGYIHPEKNRTFTQREAARIKSFKDDFVFHASKQNAARMIANAFPYSLAVSIGEVINTAYNDERIIKGDYSLYLNDCENIAEELKLSGVKADAIITDPPLSKLEKSDFTWLEKYISLLDKNGCAIIFTDSAHMSYLMDELIKLGMDVKDTIYWEVSNPAPQDRRYVLDLTAAVWAVKKGSRWTFNIPVGVSYLRPLFETSQIHGDEYNSHPEQKSVMLMEKLVAIHTNEGDTVIDPFMGSGTTAEAAVKNNRKFIGCEIDEEYIKLTKDRISSLTYRLPIG